MCWVGLQCLLDLANAGHIQLDVPARQLEQEGHAIRASIDEYGFSRQLGSYVGTFGTNEMDATLLLLGINGYIPPDSEKMMRTLACVRDRLDVNELLYRYDSDDGLSSAEGAFGLCSFWETELLALQGRIDDARIDFDHVSSFANDVGLFAEEIDPHSGAALGNFPQAFTHVGLISAAAAIARAEGRAPERGAEPPRTTRARPAHGDGSNHETRTAPSGAEP
jgi:GH15 family glucan-1,4-alpha-glucosidase